MPPGRALRTFERRLLEDVAAQAGVAFRNALLEAELAARVAAGPRSNRRSWRRPDDGWSGSRTRRGNGSPDAIRRGVVPHLLAVDAGLTTGPGSRSSTHTAGNWNR